MTQIERLSQQIVELRAAALAHEARLGPELEPVHAHFQRGARNLAHYIAARRVDLRPLQRELATLGLSSLGRMEKCVLPTFDAVAHALRALVSGAEAQAPPAIDFDTPEAELERNASALLGSTGEVPSTRIMITLADDADADAIARLLEAGAQVARINCAKGDRKSWSKLADQVRTAERQTSRSCRILCDLPGPNPRTCALGAHEDDGAGHVELGDSLFLLRDKAVKKRLSKHERRHVALGVTLPQVLSEVKPGQRVFYDDSALIGKVVHASGDQLELEVTFVQKPELKIKYGKTLNFPDTELALDSLTQADLAALDFIVTRADAVGFSFVRSPEDVVRLQAELRARAATALGIVLKIETPRAFRSLPRLLLQAMQSPHVGVMVARGDMAVELGFVGLAEAQEEILWLCEAALVPVIWATQVLESLNKSGVPSRAEVTDAAMSARAECVMLNRGPQQRRAVEFLREILARTGEHHQKKRDLLKKLEMCE
ncbi:MAG TPA: pyruvate kinase [Polyangiaceae bacterium]|jgi:pyruvate kinase|nr:pyruvate kinase [Polyangiaceae bacterium]